MGGPSNHGRRRASRPAARMLLTGLALALVFGIGPLQPAGSAGTAPAMAGSEPVVGSQELIGRLIPITGDPLKRRSVDLRVVFRKNSAGLGENAVAQLRELGEALVSEVLREVPIGIYGHTDTGGPADFNQNLSERRAQAVAAWLREHFDIPGARYREVRGYGEERPRGNLSPADPAQRRVEIVTFHDLASDAEREDSAGTDASAAPAPTEAGSPESGGNEGDGVVVTVPGAGQSPPRTREAGGEEGKANRSGLTVVQ